MVRSKLGPKTAFTFAGVLSVLGITSSAYATPTFPGVVAQHLGLSAPPDCTLCHIGTPARGNVTTPFGATLRTRGAQAGDEASLRVALDALAAEGKDSDGDGTSDIDELRNGDDPNGAGAAVTPEYGCVATPGRVSAPANLTFTILLGVVLAVRRARITSRR